MAGSQGTRRVTTTWIQRSRAAAQAVRACWRANRLSCRVVRWPNRAAITALFGIAAHTARQVASRRPGRPRPEIEVLPGAAPELLSRGHTVRGLQRHAAPVGLLQSETDRAKRRGQKGGVGRPLERAVEGRISPEAEVTRGYCLAVRSALTDDGRPPLCASGLKLRDRLEAIDASLGRLAEKGACRLS